MTGTPAPRARRTAAWRSKYSAPTRVTPSRSRKPKRLRPGNRRRLKFNNRSNSIAGRAMPSFSVGWAPSGARPFFVAFLRGRAFGRGHGAQGPPPDVQTEKAGDHFQQSAG